MGLANEYIGDSLKWAAGNVTSAPSIHDTALELLTGDMLDTDLSTATIVYINQACIPSDVLSQLVDKILTEGDQVTDRCG